MHSLHKTCPLTEVFEENRWSSYWSSGDGFSGRPGDDGESSLLCKGLCVYAQVLLQ